MSNQKSDIHSQFEKLKARVDSLTKDMPSTASADFRAEYDKKMEQLDLRMKRMEVAAPAALRALSEETIKEAIAGNPYVTFEILEDWGAPGGSRQFTKGSSLRADFLPSIMACVQNGLLLGVPTNQDEQVRELRTQKEMRVV